MFALLKNFAKKESTHIARDCIRWCVIIHCAA